MGHSEIAPIQQAWILEYQRMLSGAEDFATQPWLLIEGDSAFDITAVFVSEVFFVPNQYGWDYLIFYGTFTYVGANWILRVEDGFVSPSWYPNVGLNVRLYEDIQIRGDGEVAVAPTWELEITDSSYKLELDDEGRVVVTAR